MSGHSKWSSIKHKKAATDAKRSQVFSKMANLISLAAKEGGVDPEMNYKLRMAIDKAKAVNMPSSNIDKAIKRGGGKEESGNLEELLMEGYGPGGKAILIKAITDNRNRTIAEVKHILSKNNGKLAEGGAVKWLFEEKGQIIIDKENLTEEEELEIIEKGVDDIKIENSEVILFTPPSESGKIKKEIESLGFSVKDFSLVFIPKNLEVISEKEVSQYEKLFNALDDNNDVGDIYYNFDFHVLEK